MGVDLSIPLAIIAFILGIVQLIRKKDKLINSIAVVLCIIVIICTIFFPEKNMQPTNPDREPISEEKSIDDYPNIKNNANEILNEIMSKTLGTENNKNIYKNEQFNLDSFSIDDSFITLYYKFKDIDLTFSYKNSKLWSIYIQRSIVHNLDRIATDLEFLSIKQAIANLDIVSAKRENFSNEEDYNNYLGITLGTDKKYLSSDFVKFNKDGNSIIINRLSFGGFQLIFK